MRTIICLFEPPFEEVLAGAAADLSFFALVGESRRIFLGGTASVVGRLETYR
jgi:hypothetical protein